MNEPKQSFLEGFCNQKQHSQNILETKYLFTVEVQWACAQCSLISMFWSGKSWTLCGFLLLQLNMLCVLTEMLFYSPQL